MASLSLTDCAIWVGALDLSTEHNQVSLESRAAELDATTFGSGGWTARRGGLKSVSLNHQGFTNYAEPDATLSTNFLVTEVVTVSPTGAVGTVAYTFEGKRFNYQPIGGTVGEMAGFSGTAMGANGVDGLVRSTIIRPKASVSATGNGTAQQLGAVSASQYMYAALHVLSAGTTLTILVESDDASDFVGATTRATIGPITSAGGTWVTRVAGPITDTYWRMRISAITGTFSIAGVIGIQ